MSQDEYQYSDMEEEEEEGDINNNIQIVSLTSILPHYSKITNPLIMNNK
jgi:hypothetical protein